VHTRLLRENVERQMLRAKRNGEREKRKGRRIG
jgi:hypothetical protein